MYIREGFSANRVTVTKALKMKLFLCLFAILCGAATVFASGDVVCYWGTWANSRPGIGAFGVEDLPLNVCTHIMYAFTAVSADGELIVSEETVVNNKSSYLKDLVALKEQQPDLKVLISCGGWSAGSVNFSLVVNNDTARANFVANALAFVEANGVDGFDVDWEYPNQREGATASDYEGFVYLLRDLKAAFADGGYLVTIAVGATQANIDLSYNISGIAAYTDKIVLMTYDYHTASAQDVTGVCSPLYAQLTDSADSDSNANATVHQWLAGGASASQLLLGIASYGRTYTLADASVAGTNASSTGAGVAGAYTQESGAYAWYELCLNQTAYDFNITQVDNSYVYASNGTFWVGYDNEATMFAKGQYAKNNSLAGVALWAIDLDDFSGQCGSVYPLINAARNGLYCD